MAVNVNTLYGPTDEIYKPHSVKRHTLGARLIFPDGRVYRYMKCGGTGITIGHVIGCAAVVTTHDSDVVVMEARSTAEWDDNDFTIRIATTGSTSSTALNLVADQYNDGYLWVNDEVGEGQMLWVEDHGAETATGSTGGIDITIHDDSVLTIGLTTASQVGLFKNPYKDVRLHTGTTGGGIALGVAPVAVTANYYFWGQTWGPCPVICGEQRGTAGEAMGVLNDTGGSTLAEAAGEPYPLDSTKAFDTVGKSLASSKIGHILMIGTADTEMQLIYLTISP